MADYRLSPFLVFDIQNLPVFDATAREQRVFLGNIRNRYREIVETYKLRGDERIVDDWGLGLHLNELSLKIGNTEDDTEAIPSLLIYLKVLTEIIDEPSDIAPVILQLAYSYAEDDCFGILTVSESLKIVTLTRVYETSEVYRIIFSFHDLEDREFMITGIVDEIRWVQKARPLAEAEFLA